MGTLNNILEFQFSIETMPQTPKLTCKTSPPKLALHDHQFTWSAKAWENLIRVQYCNSTLIQMG